MLPYKDSELEATDEAKLRVYDVVREYRPDVLITHWSGSIHRDHAVCTSIVEEALFYAGLPSVQREHPAHNVGLLCFGENWEDPVGFQPELHVNVGAAYETWVQAMRTYELFGGSTSSFPLSRLLSVAFPASRHRGRETASPDIHDATRAAAQADC